MDGETRLARLKVDPQDFLGRTIVTCGWVWLGDSYYGPYYRHQDAYYSLRFREWGKDAKELSGEEAYLYLSRERGSVLVDKLLEHEEKSGRGTCLGLRVKIGYGLYYPNSLNSDWNYLELVDFQHADEDSGYTRWGPWMTTPRKPSP